MTCLTSDTDIDSETPWLLNSFFLQDQLLSFPPLEGIEMDKDDQEPDTNQTVVAETKVGSYKDSK